MQRVSDHEPRLPTMPVEFLSAEELKQLSYWVPSPAEINKRTREIRSGWTSKERQKRAVMASCVQLLPVRLAMARGASFFD